MMWKSFAVGLSASLMACSPAQATTFSLGTLVNGVPTVTTDTLTKTNPSDIITFSLGAGSAGLGGALRNLVLSIGNASFNFSSLTATFYTQSGNVLMGTLQANVDQNFSLSSGDYYAVVTGVRTGNSGGIYSLALLAGANANPAAPAPGPAGWLVMGAGLGALVLLRRRAAGSEKQSVTA